MITRTPEQIANFHKRWLTGLQLIQPTRSEVEARIHQAILREWTESQEDKPKPVEKPSVASQGIVVKELEQLQARTNYLFNKVKEIEAKKKQNGFERPDYK